MAFAYVVRTTIAEPRALDEFVQWLRDHHVGDVCDAGAEAAEIVMVDDPRCVECRYRFASRDAFAAYERDHAPRLRKHALDVLARLGVTPTYARSTGEILAWNQAATSAREA